MRKSTQTLILSAVTCILVVVGLLLLLWLRPDPDTEIGRKALLWFLAGACLLPGLIGKIFSPLPKCTIFFGPERELYYDSERKCTDFRYIEKSCGRNAIGVVRTCNGGKVHFCGWHDPQNKWMSGWLARRNFTVNMHTVKRFESGGDAQDDNRSAPDYPD